jgi:hypothetical protein
MLEKHNTGYFTPKLMEQVEQPSQQITPDKPDSGEDS